jgi:hypothetical protein
VSRREKDPRDLLIDAAMRMADLEDRIRGLTREMRSAGCESSPPCWAEDRSEAWKRPEGDLPDDYCDACVRSTILRRERHVLKMRRGSKKESVLRAAARFRGSIWGACAGPSPGSRGVNGDHVNAGGTACNPPSLSVTTSP